MWKPEIWWKKSYTRVIKNEQSQRQNGVSFKSTANPFRLLRNNICKKWSKPLNVEKMVMQKSFSLVYLYTHLEFIQNPNATNKCENTEHEISTSFLTFLARENLSWRQGSKKSMQKLKKYSPGKTQSSNCSSARQKWQPVFASKIYPQVEPTNGRTPQIDRQNTTTIHLINRSWRAWP